MRDFSRRSGEAELMDDPSVDLETFRACLADLAKVLASGAPVEKRAAALALKSCPDPQAAFILSSDPALADAVRTGRLTWENLNDAP